jgi:hypothetical protein
MRPIRIIATPAMFALIVFGLVGCKAADALSTQEVTVHFVPGSSESAHIEVQQTCGLLPNVSPQPLAAHANDAQAMTDVHFLVKPASDANKQRLFDCLGKFPKVVLGYDNPDM